MYSITALELAAQERPSFKGPIAYLDLGVCIPPWDKGIIAPIVPILAVSAEHVFFKTKKWYCNGRAGYGSYHNNGYRVRTIPVGIIFFNGKGKSHIEAGLGLSYTEGTLQSSGSIKNPTEAYYFLPSVGYRFQKPTGGLFLKVAYAPFIKIKEVSDHALTAWYNTFKTTQNFTVGIGYFFAQKKRNVE